MIKSGGVCADIPGTALADAKLLVSEQTKVIYASNIRVMIGSARRSCLTRTVSRAGLGKSNVRVKLS